MRKGKTASSGNEGGESKSLNTYFKQRKSTTQSSKFLNLEAESGTGIENKGKGFFACYLLTSLSPRHKGHTYIGFTVNPRRRIRQHNGEIGSGAWRTKSRRPWDMVVCIYGFPTNVSALQFEWAWQHPRESVAVRQAAATFKSFFGVANKIKLAYTMLTLPAWQSLNITVNYFSTKYTKHSACCPSLPEQMKVQVCPMDEFPCYTEQDEFENKDDFDNLYEYDEINDTCETVSETYSDELVTVSADNSHSIPSEQFEHIEAYGTRKPGESTALGAPNGESQFFSDSLTGKETSIAGREFLRGKQFTYASEADEDPQPWVGEKPSTTYEEYENLGDSSTFGEYHKQPFDVICSPVATSSSIVTCLSNRETAEGGNISIIENDCQSQKQFTDSEATKGDQQPWTREKPLTTEVAVMEEQLPCSTVAHEVEVVDLLTPSPNCRVRSYSKKRRISMFSPEIIDLT
ncbi:hypothetical protein PTKIN_Ptkin03bG0002400 [Pterospermum kingtungense]